MTGAQSSERVQRKNLRWKHVMRWDRGIRTLRLGRLMWERGTVGDGKGYSVKLSIALTPRLFRFARQYAGWHLTVAGVRVHLARSYGGRYV